MSKQIGNIFQNLHYPQYNLHFVWELEVFKFILFVLRFLLLEVYKSLVTTAKAPKVCLLPSPALPCTDVMFAGKQNYYSPCVTLGSFAIIIYTVCDCFQNSFPFSSKRSNQSLPESIALLPQEREDKCWLPFYLTSTSIFNIGKNKFTLLFLLL